MAFAESSVAKIIAQAMAWHGQLGGENSTSAKHSGIKQALTAAPRSGSNASRAKRVVSRAASYGRSARRRVARYLQRQRWRL